VAQQQRPDRCAEALQQHFLLTGCVPESEQAPPQPQENPDTGCTAIAAANSQEIIFGEPTEEYISEILLVTPTIRILRFIALRKTHVQLCVVASL